MDKKRAQGHKNFFPRFGATTTPTLIVSDGDRDAVVFVNEGPATVYCGISGVPQTSWMALSAGQSFADTYSNDSWWAVTAAGSGTISGFIVQGG
jgi:hypothetical protein